jgi:dTDP-4-amino-4,6-dideoxygalactose transaminase
VIPRARPNYNLADLARASRAGRDEGRVAAEVAELLEKEFESREVLLAPSGRASLYFLLKALTHSVVVVPAFTCSAVVEAALLAGKSVRFVDARRDSYNLHPEDLASALDGGCVFVATHQYGQACEAREMASVCRERGALMIEDIAAALGARCNGRLAGLFSVAAFGSFDTTKLVHAPLKSGFIVTGDVDLAARCRKLMDAELSVMPICEKIRLLLLAAALVVTTTTPLYRAFHWLHFRRRHTAETGIVSKRKTRHYLYRMADWQAAIVAPQLRDLASLVERRRANYDALRRSLSGIRSLVLPPADPSCEWACVRFAVLAPSDKLRLYKAAIERGVDMGFSFTSIACPESYVHAHDLAARVLNLPFYDKLTDAERNRLVTVLRRLDGSYA